MIPQDLEKFLIKGELSAAYLILNEEPYWTERLTKGLRSALQKKGEVEEVVFQGNEWTLDQLLSDFASYSMFAQLRFIRILEAERIKKTEWEKVASLLHEKNMPLTVIFVSHKKENFREASKNLAGIATIVECAPLKAREVPFQATFFAKEEGKVLNPHDARLMTDYVGTDLLSLKNQITLLSIFVGEKRIITEEDIQALFTESADKEVFGLTRALSEHDQTTVFCLLRKLLDQGEAPVRLLGFLARHFRLLFKTKLFLKNGRGASDIASSLRLPSFVVDQYISEAKNLNWKKLIDIYRKLFLSDRALKSSPLPSNVILEKLMMECI